MKITKLVVNNFKGIENLEYCPSKNITFVTGMNGSGKSSLLGAVKYAVTGEVPKGEILKSNAEKVETSVTIGNNVFSRNKKVKKDGSLLSGNKLNGSSCTLAQLREILEDTTKIKTDSNKIAFSSELVKSMSSAELGNFLNQYIPEKLNVETVLSFITVNNIQEKIIREKLPKMPETFEIDELKGLYKNLYDERKLKKKEKENLESKIGIDLIDPGFTTDQVDDQLNKGNKYLSDLRLYEENVKNYNKQLEERKKYQDLLVKINEELKKYDAITEISEETKSNTKKKKAELENVYNNAIVVLKTLEINRKMFEEQIVNLNSSKCPLADVIKCTSIDEKIKAKSLIEKQIADIIASQKLQTETINKAKTDALKVKEEIEKEDANQKLFYEKKQLLSQKNTYEDILKKELIKPEEFKIIPNSEQVIEDLKLKRAMTVKYEEQLKNKKELEIVTAEYDIFNTLTKMFDPKSEAISKIITNYLSVFNDICKEQSDKLGLDISVRLVQANGITIMAKSKNSNNYLNFESLSEGEQTIVIYIIMDMINALTGSKILIMDSLECLDAKAYMSLIKVLVTNKDMYDHIFIAMVDHKDEKDFISYDNKEIYTLLKENADLLTF